jgi:hypothetical protein
MREAAVVTIRHNRQPTAPDHISRTQTIVKTPQKEQEADDSALSPTLCRAPKPTLLKTRDRSSCSHDAL